MRLRRVADLAEGCSHVNISIFRADGHIMVQPDIRWLLSSVEKYAVCSPCGYADPYSVFRACNRAPGFTF